MSILGIDYGDRKVGLALSDSRKNMALPFKIIQNKGNKNLIQEIKKICQWHDIEKIVVGLPLTEAPIEKDMKNEQIQKVLAFINRLQNNLTIAVESEDERMSTKMANTLLHQQKIRPKDDDAVAAMLILQSYLDKQN